MTDLFEEMGFDTPRSRWDAERYDDFETITDEDEDELPFEDDEEDPLY